MPQLLSNQYVPVTGSMRTIARSFADVEREFSFCSRSDATIGWRVRTTAEGFLPQIHTGADFGQVQGFSNVRNAFFTIRSSSEWNVMIASRPPGFSRSCADRIASFSPSSSPLTAMRIA